MANVYDIVIRPIITERSMASVADKKYVCLLYTSPSPRDCS